MYSRQIIPCIISSKDYCHIRSISMPNTFHYIKEEKAWQKKYDAGALKAAIETYLARTSQGDNSPVPASD